MMGCSVAGIRNTATPLLSITMSHRAFLLTAPWWCLLCAAVVDADDRRPQPDLVTVTLQDDDSPEVPLPPLVVQPPETTAEPEAAEFQEGGEPDVSPNSPGLAAQDLGQPGAFGVNTGLFRGPGSLFDTPVAASIRTREEIAERQASDMFHALQNEVGVLIQATAAGQASPFVRGLTGQQVLLLIDGIRMNNSFYRLGPNQYFNTIDPGMVDHVEVLRGQGSVLWGSGAIGGVINVVTRGADVHYGMFHDNYSGGEFTQYYNTSNSSPYSRLNVEGWVGSTGAFGGGSFLNVRNLDTAFDAFPRQPGTNYQQYAGDVKFNYLIDPCQMVTVALQHFEQEDLPRSDRFPGYPGDRNGDNANGTRATFFDPQQRDLAYLRYQALEPCELIDAATFTASYHRQRETRTQGVVNTGFQEVDIETLGLNLVMTKDLCQFGKVSGGVDWYHDDADSPFGGLDRRGNPLGPILPDDSHYETFGIFLVWDIRLTERLGVNAGARYEHVDLAGTPVISGQPLFVETNFHDWVGQAGVTYAVTDHLRLVGSVSEGFRAPNLDELFAQQQVLQAGTQIPSLGLTPEHAYTYEVGLKMDGDRFRVQTFVFWTDLQDAIVRVDAGANQLGLANQDTYLQGVELAGEYLLNNRWSVYGNFWYVYGRNRATDAPMSRIPPTQGICGMRYRDPCAARYFDFYTWMSRRQDRLDPVSDASDERIPLGGTPGFATLNLRAGQAFGCYQQHQLSLSVENITDQPYLVHGSGVFGTGVTARLGYTLSR